MLSFVVQNFYLSKPFLTKTQKYNHLLRGLGTHLVFLFLKSNLRSLFHYYQYTHVDKYIMHFMHINLLKPFWRVFKKLVSPYMGLLSNNISKSLSYYTVRSLDNLLSNIKGWVPSVLLPRLVKHTDLVYVEPIPTVSLAFQKTLYNTLMVYMMYFLTHLNTGARFYFKLTHGFLLLPLNINLYMFCNCFYFKIRNY